MTPYFSDFASFVAMGGHGVYVWSCYGVVLAMVVFAVFYVRYERRRTLHKIITNHARKLSSHARTQSSKPRPPSTANLAQNTEDSHE